MADNKKLNTEIHALKLMEKHGLNNWVFSWIKSSNKVGRAGDCNHKKKIIRLSPLFVELNSQEHITNTILHEIAHALTPNHGHNKFWKRKAIEIGCTGSRTYSKEVIRRKQND